MNDMKQVPERNFLKNISVTIILIPTVSLIWLSKCTVPFLKMVTVPEFFSVAILSICSVERKWRFGAHRCSTNFSLVCKFSID